MVVWRFFWRRQQNLRYTARMDNAIFITAAYAITGMLLGLLILTSWLAARRARRELDGRE